MKPWIVHDRILGLLRFTRAAAASSVVPRWPTLAKEMVEIE